MITITYNYFEYKNDNFKIDRNSILHQETIGPAPAADVMREYRDRGNNHDLTKYSARQIINVEEA